MNKTLVRTLSGLLFIGVMVGGLLLGRGGFYGLFTVMTVALLEEFYRISLGNRHRGLRWLAIYFTLFAFALVSVYRLHAADSPLPARFLALIPFLLVLLMGGMVLRHRDFKDYAYLFTGLLYIGLPMVLSPLVTNRPDGSYSGILMLAFFDGHGAPSAHDGCRQ